MTTASGKWERIHVGDVATVVSGYAFKSKHFQREGIPVIKIGNVRLGYVDISDTQCVDPSFLSMLDERYHVVGGDLLISLTGSHLTQPNSVVGRVAIHARSHSRCLLNQRVGKIIVDRLDRCNSLYLFYALYTEESRHAIALMAHGAASQANVSPRQVESLELSLPPLPTQRKIAAILSAYDDLIENNTRRIAILEEMARMIYREWFVQFRFPGFGETRIVESPLGPIPGGWEVRPFSSIANFVNGYAFKPHHWGRTGKPIVKIAELKNGITATTPFYNGSDIPQKYDVTNGDVLFSWSADLDVYIWAHGDALLNQHLFNVIPLGGFSKAFLFYSLKHQMQEFRNRSLGTTMRHIKRVALDQVLLVVPPLELTSLFDTIVGPLIQLIVNLTSKNTNLRRTRDRLLPRLVSGEVDVSELDIDIKQ